MKNNAGHNIDWEKKEVLDRESDFEKRKMKVAVYINALDDGTRTNPDKVYQSMNAGLSFFHIFGN